MLCITIPEIEFYNEKQDEFITINKQTLCMEHSLISISKWESKYHKPFISKHDKTHEETIDYIKFMTTTSNVDDIIYNHLPIDAINKIKDYISDSMTATTFYGHEDSDKSREVVTSELIYYWMISLNIPMECQKWHINRLLTLIRVCNIKNSPHKKMSTRDLVNRNAELNAARKKKFKTRG